MEAQRNPDEVQETIWTDLQRDEALLRAERHVLRAMQTGEPLETPKVSLTEPVIREVFAGLLSPIPEPLVVTLLRIERSGSIPPPSGSLDALIDELAETLHAEGRLLAAER